MMMRRSCVWTVMVAFVLALAGPVLAQQSAAPAAPAPAPAQKAPAKAAATPVVKAKTASGTVKSATADSVVLVAGKDKKEWAFEVDKETKITKVGKAATAADLAADDNATVTYTEADGKMHAKSVTVKAVKTAKMTAKPKP